MTTKKLQELTNKKHIFFTKSGDHAIKYSLKYVQSTGKEVLLQDQGGWITYGQFCKKFHIQKYELKTDFGIISLDVLKKFKDSLLLINSMPGYHALQDMKRIEGICKKNKILIINDVSGSIGTKQARLGDIIFGSFGKNKPINLLGGGFIATNNKDFFGFLQKNYDEHSINSPKLYEELKKLPRKLKMWGIIRKKIISELNGFRIIHPCSPGINIIVAFSNNSEREKLINYCNKENYEFAECPRKIRVLENALSIEVKNIQNF